MKNNSRKNENKYSNYIQSEKETLTIKKLILKHKNIFGFKRLTLTDDKISNNYDEELKNKIKSTQNSEEIENENKKTINERINENSYFANEVFRIYFIKKNY